MDEEAKRDFERILEICLMPSTKHPKGGHAYTHFMADFDEIRAICKKRLSR